MTAYPKMANIYIANILPILVIFCKEIKNILDVIFLGLLHSKDNFYVIAYLRSP